MQAEAYITAWRDREIRTERRLASMKEVIAATFGLKKQGGGRMTMKDFLPRFAMTAEDDPEAVENKLKAGLRALARRKKR